MNDLLLHLKYEWEPFTVSGKHLTVAEHKVTRLNRTQCSHLGAVVYKWEGLLQSGPHAGKIGILIGETGDLRQRIKQYATGTQEQGNAYWRKVFLSIGDIRLYILRLREATFGTGESNPIALDLQDFSSGSRRVAFEQLLVMNEIALNRPNMWLVNRKL